MITADEWRETAEGNARVAALYAQNCAKLMRQRDALTDAIRTFLAVVNDEIGTMDGKVNVEMSYEDFNRLTLAEDALEAAYLAVTEAGRSSRLATAPRSKRDEGQPLASSTLAPSA